VVILQYHQIMDLSADLDPWGLVVSPAQFEWQIAYLHRAGFRCLSLNEALRAMTSGSRLPHRSVVLTFDDGYRDLYTVVQRVLAKFDFVATVFVVTSRMGQNSDWYGQKDDLGMPLLSWAEAVELTKSGFTFGSHTDTHPFLPQLGDEAVGRELRDSKAILEARLGVSVEWLAYPYNQVDERVRRLVAECGYAAACGNTQGPVDRFHTWRTECNRTDTALAFVWKAHGGHQWVTWIRQQSLLGRRARRARCLTRAVWSVVRPSRGRNSQGPPSPGRACDPPPAS
jgi:peptidoglycan/xylan/chitin deacetylase (PgdA/CDA1 family)